MKLLITIALGGALIAFTNYHAFGQCDDESFLDNCAAKLDGNTFLKAYKIKSSEAKDGKGIEYSYVLSKGKSYKLTVCNDNSSGGKMIVQLFNRSRKLIASSFDRKSKRFYPALGYTCTATGVYYLKFTFQGEGDGCGVSVLGFKK